MATAGPLSSMASTEMLPPVSSRSSSQRAFVTGSAPGCHEPTGVTRAVLRAYGARRLSFVHSMNFRVASFAPSLSMACPSACSAYTCSTPYRVISASAARANETPVQPWGRGRPLVPMMYFFSGEQSDFPCMMKMGVPSIERKSA